MAERTSQSPIKVASATALIWLSALAALAIARWLADDGYGSFLWRKLPLPASLTSDFNTMFVLVSPLLALGVLMIVAASVLRARRASDGRVRSAWGVWPAVPLVPWLMSAPLLVGGQGDAIALFLLAPLRPLYIVLFEMPLIASLAIVSKSSRPAYGRSLAVGTLMVCIGIAVYVLVWTLVGGQTD